MFPFNGLNKKKQNATLLTDVRSSQSNTRKRWQTAKDALSPPIGAKHSGTCRFRGKKIWRVNLEQDPISWNNNNKSDSGRTGARVQSDHMYSSFNAHTRLKTNDLRIFLCCCRYILNTSWMDWVNKDASGGYFGLFCEIRGRSGLLLCSSSGHVIIFI